MARLPSMHKGDFVINSNFNEEFSHSKDYWDKKTNDTKILISKLG